MLSEDGSAASYHQEPAVYSGALTEGTDRDGSYDRVITTRLANCISVADLERLMRENLIAMTEANRSRFVIRAILPFSAITDLTTLAQACPNHEITYWPDGGNIKVFIGYNCPARCISEETRAKIYEIILAKIDKHNQAACEGQIAERIKSMASEGYQFRIGANSPEELLGLWGNTFGWTLEQCQAILTNPPTHTQVYSMVNPEGSTIAACMISDGETTEWAVAPGQQQRGLIAPLLAHAHTHYTQQYRGTQITADLRHDYSVGPALACGMQLALPRGRQSLIINHVTIGDKNGSDQPDPWNRHKPNFGNTNGMYLRTFVAGYLLNPTATLQNNL